MPPASELAAVAIAAIILFISYGGFLALKDWYQKWKAKNEDTHFLAVKELL